MLRITKHISGACCIQRFDTFLLVGVSNPTFCKPSQFVSWSAHPFKPPSETYVSALHDMWSTNARKLLMMGGAVLSQIGRQRLWRLVSRSIRIKSSKEAEEVGRRANICCWRYSLLQPHNSWCAVAQQLIYERPTADVQLHNSCWTLIYYPVNIYRYQLSYSYQFSKYSSTSASIFWNSGENW